MRCNWPIMPRSISIGQTPPITPFQPFTAGQCWILTKPWLGHGMRALFPIFRAIRPFGRMGPITRRGIGSMGARAIKLWQGLLPKLRAGAIIWRQRAPLGRCAAIPASRSARRGRCCSLCCKPLIPRPLNGAVCCAFKAALWRAMWILTPSTWCARPAMPPPMR